MLPAETQHCDGFTQPQAASVTDDLLTAITPEVFDSMDSFCVVRTAPCHGSVNYFAALLKSLLPQGTPVFSHKPKIPPPAVTVTFYQSLRQKELSPTDDIAKEANEFFQRRIGPNDLKRGILNAQNFSPSAAVDVSPATLQHSCQNTWLQAPVKLIWYVQNSCSRCLCVKPFLNDLRKLVGHPNQVGVWTYNLSENDFPADIPEMPVDRSAPVAVSFIHGQWEFLGDDVESWMDSLTLLMPALEEHKRELIKTQAAVDKEWDELFQLAHAYHKRVAPLHGVSEDDSLRQLVHETELFALRDGSSMTEFLQAIADMKHSY